MKKVSQFLLMLIFVSAIVGCEKEDNDDNKKDKSISKAEYEVSLEGEIIIKNNNGLGFLTEITDEFTNEKDSVIMFSSSKPNSSDELPEESIIIANMQAMNVGDTLYITSEEDKLEKEPQITVVKNLSNKKETYYLGTAKLVRESNNTLSFTTTFFVKNVITETGGSSDFVYKNLTGYIISDEVKKIGQKDE